MKTTYLLQLSKTKYDGKHTSKQSYYQLKILLLFVANKSALFCCIRQLMYSMERQAYQVFFYSIINIFETNYRVHNFQMATLDSVLDKYLNALAVPSQGLKIWGGT